MRKIVISTIFSFCIIGFSYSALDLEQAMDPSELGNTYWRVDEYFTSQTNDTYEHAYDAVSSVFGSDTSTLKAIQNGDVEKCIDLFDKMWIKKRGWEYSPEDFYNCQDKVDQAINNYVTSDLNNKSVEDSTKWENVLADGDEENGPYDLLIDMKNINSILFKDEIKLSTKFDDDNENWENNKNEWDENNKNWEEDKKWWKKNHNNGWKNGKGNKTWWKTKEWKWKEWEWWGGWGWWDKKDKKEWWRNNYQNPNLQFWNICLNNNIGWTNNWWWGGGWWWGGLNRWSWWSDGFNTFTWWYNDKGGYIWVWWSDTSSWFINTWYYIWSWNEFLFSGLDWLWWGGSSCPPEDYILAICVKLIPAWPRWPVWWTVHKRSIEEWFRKTMDTLKEIKQNFITLAWHGDESLDIDYKHVDLPNHFAFNIVLNKKPVFDFKRDKKSRKEANETEGEYPWQPASLEKLEHKEWVANPYTKDGDKNRHLLTNTDYVKPQKRVRNNIPKLVESSSSQGIYKVEMRLSDYIGALSNGMDAFNQVSKSMRSSTKNMFERSKIDY